MLSYLAGTSANPVSSFTFYEKVTGLAYKLCGIPAITDGTRTCHRAYIGRKWPYESTEGEAVCKAILMFTAWLATPEAKLR